MSAEPDEEDLERMRRALAKLKPIEREIFMLSATLFECSRTRR